MAATTLYNLVMLPVYVAWRVASRIAYICSAWWFWKRVFGIQTGKADVVSRWLHRP